MNSPFPHPGSSSRDEAVGACSAKSLPTIRSTTLSGVGTKPFTNFPFWMREVKQANEHRNIRLVSLGCKYGWVLRG